MLIKVQKWGNSLALRIPKSFAKEVHLKNGSQINLTVSDGKLIVEPVPETEYVLEELLSEVKEDNIHSEVSYGEKAGKEVW